MLICNENIRLSQISEHKVIFVQSLQGLKDFLRTLMRVPVEQLYPIDVANEKRESLCFTPAANCQPVVSRQKGKRRTGGVGPRDSVEELGVTTCPNPNCKQPLCVTVIQVC